MVMVVAVCGLDGASLAGFAACFTALDAVDARFPMSGVLTVVRRFGGGEGCGGDGSECADGRWSLVRRGCLSLSACFGFCLVLFGLFVIWLSERGKRGGSCAFSCGDDDDGEWTEEGDGIDEQRLQYQLPKWGKNNQAMPFVRHISQTHTNFHPPPLLRQQASFLCSFFSSSRFRSFFDAFCRFCSFFFVYLRGSHLILGSTRRAWRDHTAPCTFCNRCTANRKYAQC
ncbi:hypothetical protein BC940DRAFT_12640 [Gongronella butleri]|nr:hypothetical protein BC940DRAFT_12640 [Gongronella butleri]